MKRKTICFVAGRSGGHIIPALTLAQQAKEKEKQTDTVLFSTKSTLDKKIVHASPDIDHYVPLVFEGLPKRLYHLPRFFWQLTRSFCVALRTLKKNKTNHRHQYWWVYCHTGLPRRQTLAHSY